MPGLPKPSYLEQTRIECEGLSATSTLVTIRETAIHAFVQDLDPSAVHAAAELHTLPVRFTDVSSEVTFLALLHLLDFGSGYNSMLVQKHQRAADEIVQFGVLGMHLSAVRITAPWMKAFDQYGIHSWFGIDASQDEELMPGVTISRPGPLAGFCNLIVRAIQQAGESLQTQGYSTLGEWILATISNLSRPDTPAPSASLVVSALVESMPVFGDEGVAGSCRVCFARRAQKLVARLALRFGPEDPVFNFTGLDRLTADTGSQVPSALRSLDILQYESALSEAIDAGEELPKSGDFETMIRAATIVAVDRMVAAGSQSFTAYELSCYLERITEPGQRLHGKVTPHIVRGTIAY